jgi:protoporphyrinogen oxidase
MSSLLIINMVKIEIKRETAEERHKKLEEKRLALEERKKELQEEIEYKKAEIELQKEEDELRKMSDELHPHQKSKIDKFLETSKAFGMMLKEYAEKRRAEHEKEMLKQVA